MEFYHYFSSEMFNVCSAVTADHIVGRADGPLEQQTNKGGKFLKKLCCCVGGSITR